MSFSDGWVPAARSSTLDPLGRLCIGLFLLVGFVGCTSSEGSGGGGDDGPAGASGSTNGGASGTGGGTAGTSAGGSPNGGSPNGGSPSGGTSSGASGASGASGTAGSGAAAGTGASGGTGMTGGAGGAGGVSAGMGGMGGSGMGMGGSVNDGDSYVTDVMVTVHPDVRTILNVTWNQSTAANQTWLEFSFESGTVLTSRPKPGAAGMHRDAVLGVPGNTAVTVRVVSEQGGVRHVTRDYSGMTGAVPSGLPAVTVMGYDATNASPERYMIGAIEDSTGGGDVDYYRSQTWLFIMDRRGRMVWYYTNLAVDETFGFFRIARDGEYIWSEMRPVGSGGTRGVVKMTLDRSYFEQVALANLSDCIDVTDDGAVLYDVGGTLMERPRTGTARTIWSCRTEFGQSFNCYSNTVNWNKAANTVLMSFPEPGLVVEIDRMSGMLVGQYGTRSGSFAFAPPLTTPPTAWNFGFQHFPNYTAAGTLLVSSHMPGYEVTSNPVANQHAFIEFTVDKTARRLTERWRYTDGPEWPHAKGFAIRLANGNTLANYGTGGVIREITADKRTVFHAKFDTPGANDFYNKMVGNTYLIDDLYALNGGGPR